MALCLPGPVRRGTEELWEVGCWWRVQGLLGEDRFLSQDPQGWILAAKFMNVRACEDVPREGGLRCVEGAVHAGLVEGAPGAVQQF